MSVEAKGQLSEAAERFRDSALGPGSSHPHWRRVRWQRFFKGTMAGLIVFAVVVVLLFVDIESFSGFVGGFALLVQGLSILLAGIAAAAITLVVIDRWADL